MSKLSDDNGLNKKDFVSFGTGQLTGFPSKRYTVFFQRPREKLTEYNRKLRS